MRDPSVTTTLTPLRHLWPCDIKNVTALPAAVLWPAGSALTMTVT